MGIKLTSKEEEILKTLSPDQKEAYEFSKSGKNIVVVAGAGYGKSYLSRCMQDDRTVVIAPTGIAALNAQGVTAHKAFSLPIGIPTLSDFEKCPWKVKELFGSKSPVKRLIIDEFFMFRSDMLHLIDKRLQKARGNRAPFGGIQVIGYGDPLQLSPILGNNEKKHFDFKTYPSVYAFDSPSFNFTPFALTTAHRHENPKHVELLRSIRFKDSHCEEALREIIKMAKPFDSKEQVTMLTNYNRDADDYNSMFYKTLKSKERIYIAENGGEDKYKQNETPVDDILRLKIGAKVLIKANAMDGSYVNGNVGVVKEMEEDFVVVTITEDDKTRDVFVVLHKWEKLDWVKTLNGLQKVVVGTFIQIPLKLAYAASIHSVQGLTLDELCINTGKGSFCEGQLFVGMSRIRNLENLRFSNPKSVTINDVIVNQRVLDWYSKIGGV